VRESAFFVDQLGFIRSDGCSSYTLLLLRLFAGGALPRPYGVDEQTILEGATIGRPPNCTMMCVSSLQSVLSETCGTGMPVPYKCLGLS